MHRLRHDRSQAGHEQHGDRYAVVVQATRLEHLNTWVVVPTSASSNIIPGPLRPVIDFGHGECFALVHAIRAVDPSRRLGDEVGFAGLTEMQEIDRALAFILGR